MEWIVLAAIVIAGLVAAIGLYLGMQDPSTRPYKPTSAGLFQLGRTALRPVHDERPDKDTNDGGPGPRRS
jgi:hypothetical protein